MSIFKSTLDPIIAAQLKARESVVSQWGDSGDKDPKGNPIFKAGVIPRDDKFLRYTSGKNSWVKMTSFVDYNDPKGNYKGDQLSKKYVLEGGTLLNNTSLRGGVGKIGSAYGSELDKISSNPKSKIVDRLYGLRPMPGIESANIINISAYGSLREATVSFYAWDKHQLSELEILFMRPGYTVLLEWGWSQYLKHNEAKSTNSTPDNITIENFTTGIDAFANYQNEDAIYDQISKLNKKYCGNYDAMLGFVKNFSWKLMTNGGFQCTTTLISRGETLETLKASTNPNIILGSGDASKQLTNEVQESRPVISFYEKIFLNLIGYINDSEITAQQGQFNTSAVGADGSPSNMTNDQQKSIREQIINQGEDILSKVKSMVFKRYNVDKVEEIENLDLRKEGFYIRPVDGGINGSAIEYITLDSFIAILNTFFVPKLEAGKKNNKNVNIVDILLPYKTPFLISEDTVSIDPTTCLLSNPKATFVTNTSDGFQPELYNIWKQDPNNPNILITSKTEVPSIILNTNNGKTNIGALGNILISVQKVIDIYRGLYGSSDGVSIVDLLNEVFENINLSLGGINNFKLYTTKNFIQIIDGHYLETGKDDKFLFDPIGLKSICRDVRINSRIFSEQASMIAIGAASSNYDNLGDIYSSTQTAFNKGLKDRVINNIRYNSFTDEKTIKIGGTEYSGSIVYYYQVANNLISLTNHLKYKVLGVNEYKNKFVDFKITRVPQDNEVINASSLLQSIHYQIDGKDVNYKSFIPFELEIELDGIGGFITGQIFKITKSILPKDYYDKNLGFVIMKQSHNLKNNDWITTLTTQICLLDNDSIPYKGPKKEDLKKIITTIINAVRATSYLKYAMADYLVYLTRKILDDDKGSNIKISSDHITSQRINSILEKIKTDPPSGEPVPFKAYLRNWVRSFQAKEDNGFPNPKYHNPQYRYGITPFETDVKLLPSFPDNVDQIEIVVDPNTGAGVKFDYNNFEAFVFNRNLYNKDKNPLAQGKGPIAPSKNPNEPQLVDDLTTQILSSNINYSFLSPGEIKLTKADGSETKLPPVISTSFYDFLRNQGLTGYSDDTEIIVPRLLYGYYLNYITNVYFPSIGQEIFIGAGTGPVSIFWSGGDEGANQKYNSEYWRTTSLTRDERTKLSADAVVSMVN